MSHRLFPTALALAFGVLSVPCFSDVFCVDDNSTASSPNGASWVTAYKDIQSAVNAASSGDEVWVAAGTYTATTNPVITMKAGVNLYGGFAETEAYWEERDWLANLTIIDGQATRRCVMGADTAVLDGFTVQNGSVSGGSGGGGGMYGGTATNCVFRGNTATISFVFASGGGGGMYGGTAINCIFTGNSATISVMLASGGGGGMYGGTATNCTFRANTVTISALASGGGGGMAGGTAVNCIFWDDSSPEIYGGTVTYSCVDGGYAGTGNTSSDPQFIDAANGDLRLLSTSPCVDVIASEYAPGTDITGLSRPQGPAADMGAYELPLDGDGDGLTYLEEHDIYLTDADDADSDDDGLNDGDEVNTYETSPLDADSDNDGYSDGREVSTGTDPNSDAEYPVLYVDVNATGAGNGTSWADAFTTIQPAVDAAVDFIVSGEGTTQGEVWVAEGTYTATSDPVVAMADNVRFYGGFAGTETTRAQRDWSANPTRIDGQDARRCVIGATHAVLDGFVVQNGYVAGTFSTGSRGGGMDGGAAVNCTFTGNTANYGGGMYGGTATDCTFTGNTASYDSGNIGAGGGMFGGTAANCSFSENTVYGGYGGGMCTGTATNCIFSENTAAPYQGTSVYVFSYGGGMEEGTAVNCTFTGNTGQYAGGGMYRSTATNCIFWGNTASIGPEVYDSSVTYSCVQGGYAGDGNIDDDPEFVDAAHGNLQLKSTSPCIDKATSTGAPASDILGNPRPMGLGVDMGAYEMDCDIDGDGLTHLEELEYGTNPNDPDSDDDNLDDGEEVHTYDTDPLDQDSDDDGYSDSREVAAGTDPNDDAEFPIVYVDGTATGAGDGASWADAFTTLQAAVDAAAAFIASGAGTTKGEVWVADGTYTSTAGYVVVVSDNVGLYGGFAGTETVRDQRDWTIHQTIIDGQEARSCVMGATAAFLDGFIVQNGYRCSSTPSIAYGGGGMAGGAATNCTFTKNTANFGAATCSVMATNCTFSENAAVAVEVGGGGGFTGWGGGAYGGTAVNCLFTGNKAPLGGGMYGSTAINSTFTENTAVVIDGYGGTGGALHSAVATNCVLWGDTASTGPEVFDSSVTYSCVEGGYTGEGNTDEDPQFIDAANGDFRLLADSPCVDAGTATGAPATDIRGVARPQGDGMDMGAYERLEREAISIAIGQTIESSTAALVYNDYILTVAESAHILVRLLPETGTGWMLYGRLGDFPTDETFDWSDSTPSATGAYSFPLNVQPGEYYLSGVYGDGSAVSAANFSFSVLERQACDVDGSGDVNAVDVQLVINAALALTVAYDCDVNGDDSVNALDVQLVINSALGLG